MNLTKVKQINQEDGGGRGEGEESIYYVWFHLSNIQKQVKICNPI